MLKCQSPWLLVLVTHALSLPDIVLFVADDVDAESFYRTSPQIQELANSGIKFERALSPSPLCTPARYSLLTGAYAARAAPDNGASVRHVFFNTRIAGGPTIATELKRAGYKTIFAGKWHTGGTAPGKTHWGPKETWEKAVRERHEQDRATIARVGGFDHVRSVYGGNVDSAQLLPKEWSVHNPEYQLREATRAISRVKAKNASAPFFLYFASTLPHGQGWVPPTESAARATPAGLLSNNVTDIVRARKKTNAMYRRTRTPGRYYVTLNEALRALRKALTKLALDDLLFVATADHAVLAKGHAYRDGVTVPLVVTWPRGVAGARRVVTEPVSLLDLAPTLLDAAGLDAPRRPASFEGVSLLKLLRAPPGSAMNLAARKNLGARAHFTDIGYSRAVHAEGHTLLAVFDVPNTKDDCRVHASGLPISEKARKGGFDSKTQIYGALRAHPQYCDRVQLYNLTNDAAEKHNLACSRSCVGERKRCSRMVSRLRAALVEHVDAIEGKGVNATAARLAALYSNACGPSAGEPSTSETRNQRG